MGWFDEKERDDGKEDEKGDSGTDGKNTDVDSDRGDDGAAGITAPIGNDGKPPRRTPMDDERERLHREIDGLSKRKLSGRVRGRRAYHKKKMVAAERKKILEEIRKSEKNSAKKKKK